MDPSDEILKIKTYSFRMTDENESINSKNDQEKKNNITVCKKEKNFKFYGIILLILGILILCLYLLIVYKKNPKIKYSDKIYINKNKFSISEMLSINYNGEVKMFIRSDNEFPILFDEISMHIQELLDLHVTSIVISDSSITDSKGRNFENFYGLVDLANSHKINIIVGLDVLFSWKKTEVINVPESFFLKTDNNGIIEKYQRIIINSSNEDVKLNIIKRMELFKKANIKDYIIFNNPQKISKYMENDLEYLKILDEVDVDLLLETAYLIKSLFKDINLYYSYEYTYEKINIKKEIFPFKGSVILIYYNVLETLITDPTLFYDAFGYILDEQKKLIYFDISQEILNLRNQFFLGLYLFSPNEIILCYEKNWIENSLNLPIKDKAMKKKFLDILKIKQEDSYFSNETFILSVKICSIHVLAALRGKYGINGKVKMTILLYNYGPKIKLSVDKVFEIPFMRKLSVIYDNSYLNLYDFCLRNLEITLKNKQLVILRVT